METIISYATAIISACSIIAAVTPTQKDDNFIGKLYRIIADRLYTFAPES